MINFSSATAPPPAVVYSLGHLVNLSTISLEITSPSEKGNEIRALAESLPNLPLLTSLTLSFDSAQLKINDTTLLETMLS